MDMLLANIIGDDGLIVIVIALIVIFGGTKLPKIARNIGAAGKEFKKGQAEGHEDSGSESSAPVAAPQPIAPQAIAPPAPQPVVTTQAPADAVVLSKAELDALIEQRLAEKDSSSN
jgi:sec-independent protein translocase protein TatA